MSLGPASYASRPAASIPEGLVAIDRSGRHRRVVVDARLSLAAGIFMLLIGVWALAATGYMLFRDEVLSGLVGRQRDMQYAYEDRIAALRVTIDRLTSRQVLDQDSFEGKMQELVSRQAQLETRQAIVASLAQLADQLPRPQVPTASAPPPQPRLLPQPAAVPLAGAARAQGGPVPDAASAYAPVAKPQPDPITLRGSAPSPAPGSGGETTRSRTSAAPVLEDETLRGAPPEQRIKGADIKLLRLETQQLATLTAFETRARKVESRYRGVLAELGLDRGRFAAVESRPQGGPLVPVKVDPNGGPFESLVYRLQTTLVEADRLRRTVEVLPLRRPLRGDADTTSGFGYRVDPFTRGMAMHTGIDFKDEHGAPVRATAAGTVSTAEWSGGYGNMVEIDHGHGLATRYAHLSALSVTEGQRVEVGTVVGRLGSTGRSTGPHLHYEMRVDGDAVDPLRWLRAGTRYGPF